MSVSFTKMNGAGNDFVLFDNRDLSIQLEPEAIAGLCHRQRGVGADGVLAVEPAQGGADFRMRYYNSDGSEAEMCGNGARCFARFARRLTNHGSRLSFETPAGVIHAHCLADGNVEITMSEPTDFLPVRTIELDGRRVELASVNTGVPHAVVFVGDLRAVDVYQDGGEIRRHEAFQPKGTNVNFVQELGRSHLGVRTYERGVEDETLACGTGVVAAALIYHNRTGAASPVTVHVAGGDTLQVGFEVNQNVFSHVTLTGPADFVFQGETF